MANVRTLLRNEKASRRICHPQASYSSTGTLICLACQLQIKSESLWTRHLTSSQHLARLQQPRKQRTAVVSDASEAAPATSTNSSTGTAKKRKAEDNEEVDDTRKKPKPFAEASKSTLDKATEAELDTADYRTHQGSGSTTHSLPTRPSTASKPSPTPNNVDEEEWAAFERDIATPPPELLRPTALNAAPTISAVPLTAEEIAKRAREESSTQAKERQEAELEGDKEDAARRLEEEFDEMDELEARVRRLREKREQLRRTTVRDQANHIEFEDVSMTGKDGREADEKNDEENDDDDDDDWNTWIR